MSSSTTVHTCLRAELCSCGFNCEPFSANLEEDEEMQRKIRPIIINSELPEDFLLEILIRLPVKSLLRFKCVCKYWYDLIRSPKFTALHYTNSMNKKKRVSLYCDSYSHDDGGYLDTTISVRFFNTPVDLKIPVYVHGVKLVGCFNGLVCLSLSSWHHQFALWNPATIESRLIFDHNPSRPKDARICSGFCFDSVSNNYKVVRVTFFRRNDPFLMITVPEGSVYVILHVFALNDSSWKEKKLLAPCRFDVEFMSGETTYIGSCMYWTVTGGRGVPGNYILCFDMVEESFKIIESPSEDHIRCSNGLHDYKGSLSMFIWNRFDSNLSERPSFDMWVLNDCGGTDQSWCKQLTLRPPDVQWPLGFFTDGNIDFVVLSTFGRCLLWDRDSGETIEAISGNGYIYPFFLYSESLASVF